MPIQGSHTDRQTIRKAILRARIIASMVQGTMGLEGQGLDARFLHKMKNETARSLLKSRR